MLKYFLALFLLNIAFILRAQDTLIINLKPTNTKYDNTAIQNAMNIRAGNNLKINFKKGIYSLNKTLVTTRPHTFLNFERGSVIQFTDEKSSGFLVQHDYFTLSNVHIKGNSRSSMNFYEGYGVMVNGASYCRIFGNTFEGISGNNIFLYPSSSGKGCNYNIIKDNYFKNPAFNVSRNGDESAILLGYSGANYSHDNNIIENNIIDGNNILKIGIGIVGHGKYNLINNNRIANVSAYGIISYESQNLGNTLCNTSIICNEISNVGETGLNRTVKGMGIYLMSSTKSIVSRNVIYNSLINSDETETLGAGAISVSLSPNVIVESNIIDVSYMYGIVSDYSFGSSFVGNTISNTRKSGMYFINMNDVSVKGNVFRKMKTVAIKGYFENTSLPYIQEQMVSDKYKNIETGNNFVISGNKFFTDNDVLFFTGHKEDIFKKYPGNLIRNNIFEKNTITGSNKKIEDLVVFTNNVIGSNKVIFNTVLK